MVLNIYPLEQSLRKLADMFGAISSNKENIIVFIAMLKSLRFTFDHEELVGNQQLKKLEYNKIIICYGNKSTEVSWSIFLSDCSDAASATLLVTKVI